MTDISNAQESSEALDSRIQLLCQELQDMILDRVLDAQVPTTVLISKTHKPPAALQLSHKTRAKFAEKYYATTIFRFELRSDRRKSLRCLTNWLGQLSPGHFQMIQHVKVTLTNDTKYEPHELSDLELRRARELHDGWLRVLEPEARKWQHKCGVVVPIKEGQTDVRRFKNGVLLREWPH